MFRLMVENTNNNGPGNQSKSGKSGSNQGQPGERGTSQENDGGEKKAESPVCGMVDGQTSILELANANRTERLQALGNGVVPTTGAIALRVLFERLVGVDYEKR